MTNERENLHVDDGDRRVSAAYRDLANEQTPESLDQSILQLAASAAKPRYLKPMSWMRPVAWAATIALCFAIALEVTHVEQPDIDLIENSANLPAADSPLRQNSAPAESSDSRAEKSKRDAKTELDRAMQSDDDASTAKLRPVAVREDKVLEERSSDSAAPATSGVADEFFAKEADAVQEAESLARFRSGNEEPVATAPQFQFSAAARLAAESAPDCDEEQTTSPTTWLECIAVLEESGQADAAAIQRELLSKTFPDFILP